MNGSILSDTSILSAVESGDIEISPFNPGHVNITSYDLTLGSEVRVYKKWVEGDFSLPDGSGLRPKSFGSTVVDPHNPSDVETISFQIPENGWVLKPGIGYLMHTAERVGTKIYNPVLDGKSSIGRLFIVVHVTAGFGDPGFDGQYTLEVLATHPVRVYAGMRFCQIRFHTIAGELSKTYDEVGHYTKTEARGARPSQAWKQFEEQQGG